ncbi:MAG: phosphate transporter periplasmic phosphate-binding protein [Massilia sp.]|nr:phosphate transporter periplasmic phosphate-binding protein [Massilia sp.]
MISKKMTVSSVGAVALIAICALGAGAAHAADLSSIPAYKIEHECKGGLRVFGNWMRGNMIKLTEGFRKFHPDCVVGTNFMTSSEGGLAGLYTGVADIAPMGDDAKIHDMMPFWDTFHYMPTEVSIAAGSHEARGSLWPAVILVHKDNPLTKLTMDELARVFGAERTGGWEVDLNKGLKYTAKYARGKEMNIRTWDQLGLKGAYAGKPIQTYGYIAPGFKIYLERRLNHWSQKWNENFKEYVETKMSAEGNDGLAVASERMLEELSKDKLGIGWGAWMHAKEYPNLKALPIAAKPGSPYVAFNAANVADRSYPLSRDYYMYINKAPGRALDPKVREFLRFALSREGQQIIAEHGVFNTLPAGYIGEQLKKLD